MNESGTRSELLERVKKRLCIDGEFVVQESTTLTDLLAKSPTAHNSLDLLDAFAGSIVDLGGDLETELPAFTMGDALPAVLREVAERAFADVARSVQ